MTRLFIYTQDIGGTRCLLPFLERLPKAFPDLEAQGLTHPLAQPILSQAGDPGCRWDTVREALPLSVRDWTKILEERRPTHILTTLSSPYLDLSNGHLIEAARSLGLPTLGLMDHWKGYDRFYDKNGEPRYLPDWVGCIDEFAHGAFLKRGIPPERVFVVGHPGLERTSLLRTNFTPPNGKRLILLVSQPDTASRSFQGVFLKETGGRPLFEEIQEKVKSTDEIVYRRHPKEKGAEALPEGIQRDDSHSIEEAIRRYHLFIGIDSMLLVEAALAGRPVLRLRWPEFRTNPDDALPYHYGRSVESIEGLADALQADPPPPDDLASLRLALKDSLGRTTSFVQRFLNA